MYLLEIIDLFLHEAQIYTTYSYVITDFVFAIPRYIGDVAFLVGLHHVVWSEFAQVITPYPLTWRLSVDGTIMIVVLMAVYAIGSLLANEVYWLQVADYDQIQLLYNRKNSFDTAYVAFQWLLTLAIVVVSMFYSYGVSDISRVGDFSYSPDARPCGFDAS